MNPVARTTGLIVAEAAAAAAMYVRIGDPVSAVQWNSKHPHPAVTGGFTRWADKHDRMSIVHSIKESEEVGRIGKVTFGMIDGDTPVEQDDYLLTHSDGFLEVYRPAEFEALFRKATKAEVEAAAPVMSDAGKIVVLENEPEIPVISPIVVGETLAQRIKNAAAPGSRPTA